MNRKMLDLRYTYNRNIEIEIFKGEKIVEKLHGRRRMRRRVAWNGQAEAREMSQPTN